MKALIKIKKLLNDNSLDAYIIPKNDEFFGEYAFPNRLKTATNFSGSAGFALITKLTNYLFVDGRYLIQSKIECGKNFKIVEIPYSYPKNILNYKLISHIVSTPRTLFFNFLKLFMRIPFSPIIIFFWSFATSNLSCHCTF